MSTKAGEVQADLIRLAEIISSQTSTIRSQDIKIQALVREVAYLRRIRYGVKSEAMSPEQRQLFDEDIVQDIAAVESELQLPVAPASPRSRAGRQALPEHLERVEVRHEPDSCTCAACQKFMNRRNFGTRTKFNVGTRIAVIRAARNTLAWGIVGKVASSIHPITSTNWKTKTQSTTKYMIGLFELFTTVSPLDRPL